MQRATGLQLYYVTADPKVGEQHMEWNRLGAVLLKIFNIHSFNNVVKIKEIALTHFKSLISSKVCTYHLIVVCKEKVAEQHILAKYAKCNSFGRYFLKSAKSAITHLDLSPSQEKKP